MGSSNSTSSSLVRCPFVHTYHACTEYLHFATRFIRAPLQPNSTATTTASSTGKNSAVPLTLPTRIDLSRRGTTQTSWTWTCASSQGPTALSPQRCRNYRLRESWEPSRFKEQLRHTSFPCTSSPAQQAMRKHVPLFKRSAKPEMQTTRRRRRRQQRQRSSKSIMTAWTKSWPSTRSAL